MLFDNDLPTLFTLLLEKKRKKKEEGMQWFSTIK
jgi:hypothetical protein